MFEELLQLVQQHSQEAVVDNTAIPNEHNQDVMNEAVSSITNGLQSYGQGNADGIMQLFQSQGGVSADHPAVQGISNNFIESITSKFGISGTQAQSIAAAIIPMVMAKFIHKTNDPNDQSFNFQNIIGAFTGGGGGGLSGLLGKFGL